MILAHMTTFEFPWIAIVFTLGMVAGWMINSFVQYLEQ